MEAKGGEAIYSSKWLNWDLNPGRLAPEPVQIITNIDNIPGTIWI